ncbi:Nucleotide-diphospho-sugar transferase [Sesbania bispinosa]|nr:Nucleotide-diphospho-sugar transferase [Sesbania bispinosa]
MPVLNAKQGDELPNVDNNYYYPLKRRNSKHCCFCFWCCLALLCLDKMQLQISPSLRHVTVLPGKGLKEFIKVRIASRRLSYRMLFYSLLFFTFLLRFVFVMTAVDSIDSENKCSTIGCLGIKLSPKFLGRSLESTVPEVMYSILDQPLGKDELEGRSDIPQTLEEFMTDIKKDEYDAKTFAIKLREMAWFSLHPLSPAIIEVKALHHFDWFTKGKVPVLEAMEKDQHVRSQFRGGSSAIVANTTEKPNVIAAKLQALSPKYNSVMNHIRIHLPEMFSSLNKVVFLDDDIVVQTDLSPLWDIDMNGKVNGAVETCTGEDKFVMSKRLKSYLNFSHPLISKNFDPNECAWAYGMNIFDLEAWRKTNISSTYHYWVDQNIKSDLSLWQLGTLPPGLIAFHGHVHSIDPFWHMLGLGYQENTSFADAESAGVIHFNGRAKPWLDIAFPQLKPLWTKYIDFSDHFIKSCHIRAS